MDDEKNFTCQWIDPLDGFGGWYTFSEVVDQKSGGKLFDAMTSEELKGKPKPPPEEER